GGAATSDAIPVEKRHTHTHTHTNTHTPLSLYLNVLFFFLGFVIQASQQVVTTLLHVLFLSLTKSLLVWQDVYDSLLAFACISVEQGMMTTSGPNKDTHTHTHTHSPTHSPTHSHRHTQ